MRTLLSVCLALVVLTCGCAKITYEVRSDKPVLLGTQLARDHQVVRRIDDAKKGVWLLWLLLPLNPERGQALNEHAAQGDALTDVSIHEYYSVVDFLIQNLSRGIVATLNEDFDGNVVKYK
ncbi:MAG: hypothetical protein FJ290_20070 [Planctomycetes bacterium]|nr:hypothetical protein [Planctomycetota bacterium]